MLGLGTVEQNDSKFYDEYTKRLMTIIMRIVKAMEKMNPDEMSVTELASYAALLPLVTLPYPFCLGVPDALREISKEV